MRIVLSRKGFDSGSGGCPSPIFPDGSMFSLPIPYSRSPVTFGDLAWSGRAIGPLVESLTNGKVRRTDFAHLDPDLRPELRPRPPGWRPALGQLGIAQSHLRKNGVGPGDLFLFWGLFRRVDEQLRWTGERLHVLWGWLQIAEVLAVESLRAASPQHWARNHPHFDFELDPKNTLYVAAERLSLPKMDERCSSGAGFFDTFSEKRQLTAVGSAKPTLWSLPADFFPGTRRPLTYHEDRDRWSLQDQRALLRTVGRGQEFVLDTAEYPEVLLWVSELLSATKP